MALKSSKDSCTPLPKINAQVLTREQLRDTLSRAGKDQASGRHMKTPEGEYYALPMKTKQPTSNGADMRTRMEKDQNVTTQDEEKSGEINTLLTSATTLTPSQSSARHASSVTTLTREREERTATLIRNMSGPADMVNNSTVRSGLDVELYLFKKDESEKISGVVELSTLRQTHVPRIRVRVVCLIDVSGSMLLKTRSGQLRGNSKIATLKNMAVDVTDALEDDEDFVGVMTFGCQPKVVCPLTKVSASTRSHVKQTISELDKDNRFSANTDLSSALMRAIDMLKEEHEENRTQSVWQQQEDRLLYRNCIIVFSDGEINCGETDPNSLVHIVREKIREARMPEDILADLWINISCVTTGSHFSHCLYLISKMCGSDAYFFVDGDKQSRPQADMLIPLMLRKTAYAQMVSVNITATNNALLDTKHCTQEYSVRRKTVAGSVMSYFLHDMPVGRQKTFQVSIDVQKLLSSDLGHEFLHVEVQYVDPLGVLHNIAKHISLEEIMHLKENNPRYLEVIAKTGISSLREILQATCRQTALALENVTDANEDTASHIAAAIDEGKRQVQIILEETLAKLTDDEASANFQNFANAIEENLNELQKIVKSHAANRPKCWQYAKAMSSAIIRELPTVSNVVFKPHIVCPKPEGQGCESKRTKALSIYVFGDPEADEALEAKERAATLQNAARDVARTLAEVLKALDTGTEKE